MKVFFIDESGFAMGDWAAEKNLADQPFHVLAGVVFDASKLADLYESVRGKVGALGISGISAESLGKGAEIKAREIAKGSGYWAKHLKERNSIREIFLGSVNEFEGKAFLSVVNKSLLKEKYASPADPTLLALEFIYERFERYLKDTDDYGICVHDQNKKNEDQIQSTLTALNSTGSHILYYSRIFEEYRIKHQKFSKVLENAFGHSEASVGLQIADFFASHTNAYLKSGRSKTSGWWKQIYESLKTEVNGRPEGYGYKEFP
jgi:hypothetical protein